MNSWGDASDEKNGSRQIMIIKMVKDEDYKDDNNKHDGT